MKEPTRGPIFACLYQGLCDISRARGYALAVHGSLVNDMDLIACPWTDQACEASRLVEALTEHLNACEAGVLLNLPNVIDVRMSEKEEKPHGRVSWNIYLHAGTKIDISVMPLKK